MSSHKLRGGRTSGKYSVFRPLVFYSIILALSVGWVSVLCNGFYMFGMEDIITRGI